jgi:LGFP repeat
MEMTENSTAVIGAAADRGQMVAAEPVAPEPGGPRRRGPRRPGSPFRRAVLLLVAAACVAAGLVGIAPSAASAASCSIQPYGLIGARWSQLGGVNSWLGCPTTGEYDVYRNNIWVGRRQYFEQGTVAWSPQQGSSMVVATWGHDGWVYFNWGSTSPYHYDKFLVRWDSAADQGTQREFAGGTSGQIRVQRVTNSDYRFIVEGCDNGTFGSSCRQGWTIGVSTRF